MNGWETQDRRRYAGWGVVHAVTGIFVPAPPQQLMALYNDYENWPRLFPETIERTRVLDRQPGAVVVEVDHRTAGRVVNIIRPRPPDGIELEEFKRRFDAIFLNRFSPVPGGTRYTVRASVRIRGGLAVFAPLLAPLVRRRVQRYVLEPMRNAALHEPRHTAP